MKVVQIFQPLVICISFVSLLILRLSLMLYGCGGSNSLHDGHIVSVPRKVGTTGTRCLEGLAKRQALRLLLTTHCMTSIGVDQK